MENENTFVALDSLCANEFKVEIEGEEVLGVFRISGFTPFNFLNIGDQEKSIVLTKMVQRDPNNAFNTWVRDSVAAAGADAYPTRTLSIVAVDDGSEVRRWSLQKAWIASISYSDFDSASTVLIEETAQIKYEKVEVQWTATSNLS